MQASWPCYRYRRFACLQSVEQSSISAGVDMSKRATCKLRDEQPNARCSGQPEGQIAEVNRSL
jgi:hypothetical protein